MSDNIAASMTASIVIDKNDLLAQILKGLSEGQKELENNKLELFFDFSNSKNKNEFEKIIQKYRKELSSEDLIIQIKNQGVEETIKSLDHLVEVIKSIASGKSFGAGLGNGIGDSIIDEKKLDSIIDLFTKMEAHLLSIKKVLSDVGEGEEFSPLFNVINKIDSSITQLSSKVSNIGLNMNIDFGSDKELEAKVEAKISNALQAYQRLFEHLKLSSVGGSYINNKFFDFDINQFDTPMSKLQAYRKFIENMRIEAKQMFNGQDILYTDTDKKYWNQASAAYGQVTRVFNEMNAASDVNPLENIFGKTDLSGVIEQLNTIVSKLDEISDSAKGFTETLKNGLNVNASVEEIEKLTNRVKELEDELAKVKTPTVATTPQESNISSDISSQVKMSDNITDQIVSNEKKKQEAYKATAETVMYHAGTLSKLNKAETNGRFYGSNRGTGYFGTGHYFVDSNSKHYLDESSTYSKLPYSSIDISQYDNLFKANNDTIAKSLHEFLKNLTRYTQGDTKFNTNELFSKFENVFGNTVMDIKEFESRINGLKDFMSKSNLSDRSDSVSTQFMKSLGYGGVDTRGTKFADTEYGTVIYDLKEESVLQANITDELQKQGQMLEKINYEKGQVFDSSEDSRLQDIINQQEKGKAIREEYNKIYDDTKLDSYSTELSEINKKLDENDEIIGNCRLGIENAEKEAQQFAKEMKELGIEMSNEEIQNSAIESKKSYQERIDELEKERPLLEARRQELEANLDAESKLSKAAMERATATVEDRMKDAFPDSSTNTKSETEGMEQVERTTEEAVQAKKDFATANEGVQSSIDGSENPLKLEAELMEQIAKSAREAADAKKEFVEANKQVKDSANKSNNDLVGGHSENAEPSGVKKYKKKGYKAHDTRNHDNEKKVSNKAELGKALKDLQSEIIASIDESTSFVKEVTDFYDSQDNLVKTQMKVGDKNGNMRTYTTSYSMDKDGGATAWMSHIETQKYQDQNKIIQEQIKNLQKLSAEKQKATESEKKSTVNQASKDQLEAWKQIQRIRKEIAGTSNAKLIEQLEQEKKTYQEQYLTSTKILKNNSDLYNSEQRLNELKKISLKTTQQIESTQQRQFNGYDNKLSGYQGKVSGYTATINKFGDDGWTSPEYLQNVQKAQKALKAYGDEIDRLKANPNLVNKESLANVEKLGKDFEDATLAIKNMTAAQKGYTQLGAEKALDKITQMVKENSKMSRQAKAEIQAWYNQIKSGNPSASLDVILGKVESIVRAEKEVGRGGKSMWDAIKEKAWYGAASVIGTYFGVNDILRYGGEVVNTVKDLNTQITELAKVSEQSAKQIYSGFDSYADIAKEVRGTISDTIAATADWSKNGYSIPDAKQLAEISQLYKNVGDGINIDEANESLISTLKGFKLEADQAEHIVDVFNEVSNNEAISSAGIGDALQRSAASFNAANTSLEQSVALVTATNSVLQDPEKVGNMWKTVSARIRGAKTELTDMGEDTDGLVESTSKLQALVKGITGVDILESDGKTFEDIYTIVSGISEKWATLSDIDRASLLESLAGKNQSNALAAALSQPEILKKAYEEATNAEGSARKENEEYAKSVQASIDLTKAKLEELSNDLLSSDFLKGAIDAGGKLIDILDGIVKSGNAIPTVATAISAALSFKKVGIDTLVAY